MGNQVLEVVFRARNEVAGVASAIKSIVQEVSAGFANLNKTASDGTAGLNTQLTNLGGTLMKVGAGLTAVNSAAIAAAAGFAHVGAEYEKQLVKIETLTGNSRQQVAAWSKELMDLAPAVGKGPGELAQALYFVASNGLKGAEALDVVKQSAMASAVGLGQTETIARAVTAAINAYGSSNLTAAHATDVMVATVREGGAEAAELAGTLGRVMPLAAQLGVSFEEVGASLATFTRLGVNSAEAVTALRGTLAALEKPSKGGAAALAQYGLTFEKLRQSVKDNGLAQTLIDLNQIFKGNEEGLAKVIPNVRALTGVLANAGQQADAYKQVLESIKNSNGTTAESFARTKETLAQKWAELQAQIEVIGTKIGLSLIPSFERIAEAIKPALISVADLIEQFSKLPPWAQQLGVLAAFFSGPLVVAIGAATTAVGAIGAGGLAGGLAALVGIGLGAWAYNSIPGLQSMDKWLGDVLAKLVNYELHSGNGEFSFQNTAEMDRTPKDLAARAAAAAQGGRMNGMAQAALAAGDFTYPGALGQFGGLAPGMGILAKTPPVLEQVAKGTTKVRNGLRDMAGPASEADKQVSHFMESLSGQKAQKEMDAIARALPKVRQQMADFDKNPEAAEQAYQVLGNMVKKMQELHQQGAQLPDVFYELRDAAAQAESQMGPEYIQKLGVRNLKALQQVTDIDTSGPVAFWMNGQAYEHLSDITKKEQEAAEHAKKVSGFTFDWQKALEAVRDTMDVLGISADSTFGRVVGGMTAAAAAGQQLGQAAKAHDIGGMLVSGASVFGSFMHATDQRSAGARALGGGMTLGSAAYSATQGMDPVSRALITGGAVLVGAIGGALRKPDFTHVLNEVAQKFGVQISDELAKSIRKTAKDLKIGNADAEQLHLGEIMSAGHKDMREGVEGTLHMLEAIKNGVVPAKEGMAALNEQFGLMRQQAQDAGRVGDAAMVAIIKRSRELGQMTPEMKAAVNESLSGAAEGAKKFMAGMTSAMQAHADQMAGDQGRAIKRLLESMADATEEERAAAVRKLQNSFGDEAASGWKVSATAAAASFMGVFNAIVKEQGVMGAVDQLSQGFGEFRKTLEAVAGDQKGAVDSILAPMSAIFDLAQGPLGGLVQAADGLRQMLIGVADAGYLDRGSFEAMETTAKGVFDQMIAGGADTHAAIEAMAPTIQAAVSAAEQMGVPLSDDMQHLKEIAEQNGITFKTDPMDQVVKVLQAIAKALGADIPSAAQNTYNAINGIPSEKTITVKWNQQGGPPDTGGGYNPSQNGGVGGGAGGSGGYNVGEPEPQYATGGRVPYTPGGQHAIVSEQSTENILTDNQLAEIMARAQSMGGMAGAPRGGDRPIVVQLHNYIGGQKLDEVISKRINAGMYSEANL